MASSNPVAKTGALGNPCRMTNATPPPAAEPADRPGVVIKPPILFLGALALGLLLEAILPLTLTSGPVAAWTLGAIGLLLVAIGAVLLTASMRAFRRAGTNVPTWLPTTAVVMNGPYRWSRNPIYVALTLIYAGIALVIGSPWLLLLMPAIVAILHWGVVAREERYLEAKFGQSYLGYKASVRRWL